jgi:uncharacterized membrane protein HdeD (DUF308 family)
MSRNAMAQPPSRTGNGFIYYVALTFVAVCVVGGLFYLIPGVYHPFSTDTATQHYRHWKIAVAFFVVAIVGLFLARVTKPNTTQ